MFKKLKDKIAEDLKFSPQRIQQLTQTVTDKLQSGSNPDENFFSIAEDDNTTTVAGSTIDSGFTDVSLRTSSPMEPRSRRFSGSSMASDVSFLPRYEPPSNMYHMQSDLDISASEFEDNASTSSQLGQISKEQVYAAFQKAQMRYHKYRGRYTDLANHYRLLEKENAKIKSVLVETQDKAIRRANELREQCSLEQKAKAHLENALRVEIDEKQMKIESLETKVKFLQAEGSADGDELNEAKTEIEMLNGKVQEMKASVIIFTTKEAEYKQKIAELEKSSREILEREKENNLKIAETKMELHAEINNKDVEINKLKVEVEKVKQESEEAIEKLKGFFDQKQIEVEQVRNDARNSLITLETKIKEKLQTEFDQKEVELKQDFDERVEKLNSSENTEKQLVETQDVLRAVETENNELKTHLKDLTLKYNDLETNHLELIKENGETIKKVASLEKEISKHLQQIKMLEVQLKSVKDDLTVSTNHKTAIEGEYAKLEIEREALQKEIGAFKATIESLDVLKGEFNSLQEVSNEHQNKNCLLMEEIEQLRKTLNESELSKASEILKLKTFLDEARENSSKVTVENDELKKENFNFKHKYEKEVENLNKIIEEKIKQLEELTCDNREKQNKIEENQKLIGEKITIEKLLETKTKECEILQNEKSNLTSTIDELKADVAIENKKMKQEILDLKVTVETLRSVEGENMKLIEDIGNMRLQIGDLLGENQSVKEEISRLRSIEASCKENTLEFNNLKDNFERVKLENSELLQRNQQLTMDCEHIQREHEKHLVEFTEFKIKYDEISLKMEDLKMEKEKKVEEINRFKQERLDEEKQLQENKNSLEEIISLRNKIEEFQNDRENHEALIKEHKLTKTELSNLSQLNETICTDKKHVENQLHELEKHYNEITHEKQLLLDEIQELKTTPLNLNTEVNSNQDLEVLQQKLKEYVSLDKANRTSIEFYENELQKLRNKNEKLGRRLDETLVTLPAITANRDCTDSSAILEYLRNVIFNYMTGKESLVLAKVIAAVCKFDKDQTELVLQREQQRQSLLGQFFAS